MLNTLAISDQTSNKDDATMSEEMTMHFEDYELLFHFSKIDDGWEAHCLGLDVVTYGDSLAHAVHMGLEAAGMIVADDLDGGHDPLDRGLPREEIFELMRSVSIGGGKRVPLSEAIKREGEFKNIFVTLSVRVQAAPNERHDFVTNEDASLTMPILPELRVA